MRAPWVALTLLSLALAGCSGGSNAATVGDENEELPVDDTTGGILGVAVDEAIRPLANVRVTLEGQPEVRSGEDGKFRFTGLAPGAYVVTGTKPGHATAMRPVVVEAGVADPDVLRLVLPRIPGKEPYAQTYKLDGVYECAFGAPYITDSCDMAVRTAYDELNGTMPPPFPRNVQNNVNTMFLDVGPGAQTIIQEAFWDDPNVPEMMIQLGSTPIDNACDCSDTDWLEEVEASPTYGRIDSSEDANNFPANVTVAARGFLPFGGPTVATNLRFTVLTTVFYNYEPAEGWTYETRDQFPV